MNRVSSVEIAQRLEKLYTQNVKTIPKYKDLVHGCKVYFSRAFENEAEFNEKYMLTDSSFANILGGCLKSKQRTQDFLLVCNCWAFWHFDLTVHDSIRQLKAQGADTFHLAPTSDVQFFKKFAAMLWCSVK